MNATEDYFRVACHEAAHQVIADLRGVSAYAEITPDGFSKLMNQTIPNTEGVCWFSHEPKPFIAAVISWSGPLAESLLAAPPDFFPPFRPSPKLLRDWHSMILQQLHRLSETDRRGINGYRNTWLACKSAFATVRKNRARIVRLAKCLNQAKVAADAAELARIKQMAWQGVPRPESFPASHMSFVELICGGTETFEKFIAHKSRAHLAGGMAENFEDAKKSLLAHFANNVTDFRANHPGKSDSEIPELQFAAEFARAIQLQRGGDFTTADSWLTAARDFQTWMNENK